MAGPGSVAAVFEAALGGVGVDGVAFTLSDCACVPLAVWVLESAA